MAAASSPCPRPRSRPSPSSGTTCRYNLATTLARHASPSRCSRRSRGTSRTPGSEVRRRVQRGYLQRVEHQRAGARHELGGLC
jgi:hypothetical protein